MKIIPFTHSMTCAVVGLWNASVSAELPYKPFTAEGFTEKFIDNPHFDYKHAFAAAEGEDIIGFAQGVCKKTFLPDETNENTPGYVTMVAVKPERRREGIGSALLRALEESFKAAGKVKSEIIFFNPINLEWVVPGTDGHEHPNTPGILKDSAGYEFFIKHGYETFNTQNSYHRDLADLPPSLGVEKVAGIIKRLSERGITIEQYREGVHSGLDELFDNLRNEHWRSEIFTYLKEHPEWPLLVVCDGTRAVGFAGPVYPQANGRGFFAGIGVHYEYNGIGAGTALFYRLCETEKERGAAYMTLFTGMSNPARKLYEAAGFTVMARWADMRKVLS